MTSSERPSSDSRIPDWAGYWRVTQYGGETPAVPTYYAATPESWDVVTDQDDGWYTARHPILEAHGDVLVLKDEGVPDDEAERWRVDVQDETVRVTALTGEHAGAVGVAERIDADPRERDDAAQ